MSWVGVAKVQIHWLTTDHFPAGSRGWPSWPMATCCPTAKPDWQSSSQVCVLDINWPLTTFISVHYEVWPLWPIQKPLVTKHSPRGFMNWPLTVVKRVREAYHHDQLPSECWIVSQKWVLDINWPLSILSSERILVSKLDLSGQSRNLWSPSMFLAGQFKLDWSVLKLNLIL